MSLLPLLVPGLPICIRNFPSCVNFSTMLSLNDCVPPVWLSSCCRFCPAGRLAPRRRRRRAAAVAADPHVAFVVDGDAVVRIGPVVALARAAPVADQIAGLIELEHRRRRRAALRGRRIRGRVHFARLERAGAMNDPDVILRVDRDADRLAEDPVVRQRLGPQRIDFEPRRLHRRGRGAERRPSIESARAEAERGRAGQEDGADAKVSVHGAPIW